MASLAAVEDGDAEGAREHDLLAGDLDGRAQRAAHLLGQSREILRGMLGDKHHCEPVAADAGERVLRAKVALQAARDGQQQAVAHDEAKRDVDTLELVDVDGKHARARAILRLRPHHRHAEAVEHELAIGQPREAVMHGVVQEALVRALGVGHVADKADTAQRAHVRVGDTRGLELEPAVGVIGVAHAEIGADLGPRALLHGPQHQSEAIAVRRVQMLDEIVDLGRKLAGAETEGGLDQRAHLDLVAARIPLPHGRAGAVDGERAQLQFARRRAVEWLARAESELGDREADEHQDEDKPGHKARDDDVAREPPRQRHGRGEDPNEEQDPGWDQRQRAVLAAQCEEQRERAADRADHQKRGAGERGCEARVDHGDGDEGELRDDPHREQHADEAMPERDAQEHRQEDHEARGDRGFACRAIDGVVLGAELEQLVEETEIDAQVGQHAPGHERGAREDGLVIRREDGCQEDGEEAGEAQQNSVEQQPVARFQLVVERLPQVDVREAVGRQFGHVGDGAPGLERDAEDVGAVALDAVGHEVHRRRHRLDALRVEVGPHCARADDVVALGGEPALDRLIGRVG